AAQAQLAACADCRRELETLGPVLGSLASWPTDVLRQAAPLWDRLAQRIGLEPGQAAAGQPEAEGKDAAPGISYKLLATDTDQLHVDLAGDDRDVVDGVRPVVARRHAGRELDHPEDRAVGQRGAGLALARVLGAVVVHGEALGRPDVAGRGAGTARDEVLGHL